MILNISNEHKLNQIFSIGFRFVLLFSDCKLFTWLETKKTDKTNAVRNLKIKDNMQTYQEDSL